MPILWRRSVSSNTTFMLLRDFVISFLLYLLTYKVPLNFLLPNNFKFIQPSDLQIIQVVTHAMHFSNKMYELPGNTATEHVINSLDSYFDLNSELQIPNCLLNVTRLNQFLCFWLQPSDRSILKHIMTLSYFKYFYLFDKLLMIENDFFKQNSGVSLYVQANWICFIKFSSNFYVHFIGNLY